MINTTMHAVIPVFKKRTCLLKQYG